MRIFTSLFLFSALLLTAGKAPAAEETRNLARLETGLGDIVIELDESGAPGTVANFKEYVKSGYYDGTVFHRVIKDFMIQGGGLTADMRTKSGSRPPIRNEAGNRLKNAKYTVAMARTNEPHSATSQFFINVKDNAFLDHKAPSGDGWGYAVFGKVIRGTDVVDRIAGVKTGGRGGHRDVPLEPVFITKAVLLR